MLAVEMAAWTASRTGVLAGVAALAGLTGVLVAVRGVPIYVATVPGEYDIPNGGGTKRAVSKGDVIPSDAKAAADKAGIKPKPVPRTLFRSLVVGADNRLSTSKSVAFAWTYVIAFALISIFIAKWLGRGAGLEQLNQKGLQEEYLLALGGPYAAAVLAKYSAVASSQTEGKPAAEPGTATPAQLVANDRGDGDLGDLQYVLFSAIAVVWVLVTFVWHPGHGLPDIPAVLAGLALTSAGAYSAKKLVAAAAPSLTSLLPPEVEQKAGVKMWGKHLVLPGSGPQDAETPPVVMIGSRVVDVTKHSSSPGGVDQLAFSVPADLAPGSYLVSAVRTDGVSAGAPGGAGGLPLRVTKATAQTTTTTRAAAKPARGAETTPEAGGET
jgi:hypothetical protein